MQILYWAYVNVFRCLRRIHKIFSEDNSKPIEIQNAHWLSVDAYMEDGSTIDVTDQIRNIYRSDALLYPSHLENALRMDDVVDWYYLTQTLEYNKIPTEGVLNGL